MAPKSTQRLAGDRLLANGPMDRFALMSAMADSVPPNVASRKTLSSRAMSAMKRGYNTYPQGEDPRHGDLYDVGARIIAVQTLNNSLRNGTWVLLPDGRVALRDVPRADA